MWTTNLWASVLFSDETPLHPVRTNQHYYYRSVRGRNRVQNIIQLRLQGTLTAQRYVDILDHHIQPHFHVNPIHIFQQDNATPHKVGLTNYELVSREWHSSDAEVGSLSGPKSHWELLGQPQEQDWQVENSWQRATLQWSKHNFYADTKELHWAAHPVNASPLSAGHRS